MLNSSGSYLVYTDGSCWTGDRIGAYAWVAIDEDDNEHIGGDSEEDTTISRMELMAAIDALDHLYDHAGPSVVMLYSDSEYVVKGSMDRTRGRKYNKDLWGLIDDLMDDHALVIMEHVRGHDGDYYNELVDGHAGRLRTEHRRSI